MVINLGDQDERRKAFEALGNKLPKEAEQRTKKEQTRKGYDTDGYGYQFCVNQFNNFFYNQWGFNWSILKEVQGQYRNGTPYWEITTEVKIWVFDKENARSCVGGHISTTYFDALKGAITNGFKKAAAFWGVGRQAYEGTMDDDNKPYPGESQNRIDEKSTQGLSLNQKSQTRAQEINSTKILFVMFSKFGFKTITQEHYKQYIYHKYAVNSMTELTADQIKEQKKILKDWNKDAETRKKFGDHLQTITGAKPPDQDNKEQSIRNEIRKIMGQIYGKNQDVINEKIGIMAVDGCFDLNKMDIGELGIILDCAKISWDEYQEALKQKKAA